jgi:hypothetical protein
MKASARAEATQLVDRMFCQAKADLEARVRALLDGGQRRMLSYQDCRYVEFVARWLSNESGRINLPGISKGINDLLDSLNNLEQQSEERLRHSVLVQRNRTLWSIDV